MAYADGQYLAPGDFKERFRAAWDKAEARYLKVERKQVYNQAGDDSFDAFVAGDVERAQRQLRETLLQQREMYEGARDRGVALVRLRLYELPLSPYLRDYEIPSYAVTARELGEDITLTEVDKELDQVPDSIIFDSAVMFVNAYDGLDRLVGAIEVRDGSVIAETRRLAEEMLSRGEPLADFSIERA